MNREKHEWRENSERFWLLPRQGFHDTIEQVQDEKNLRCFCVDITATRAAEILGYNRRTIDGCPNSMPLQPLCEGGVDLSRIKTRFGERACIAPDLRDAG